MVYQSGGEHRFYTGTTSTVYGTNRFNVYSSGVNVTGDYYDDGRIIQNHLFNNLGRTHATFQDFNSPSDFGCHFIQNSTNGPNTNSGQYYEMTMGLGSEYYSGSPNGNYGLQLAYNRYNEPYMSMRRLEGGTWQGWQKIYSGRTDSLIAGCYAYGELGMGNGAPVNYGTGTFNLHIARCQGGAVSRGYITIARDDNNGSVRQQINGWSSLFDYVICGDGGGSNSNATWIQQVYCSYAAPVSSLVISSTGYVTMRIGYGTSDQRIKTNIKTIDNALWKVQQLRGVEYNDIKLGSRHIGLIAQEVEHIIPEVVTTNKNDDLKSIAYGNLVGLLIEAIKEQQEEINSIKNILKNNNLI